MELAELDRLLQQLATDRHRREKLRRDQVQLREQISELEAQRNEWQEQVRETGDDLRKLEGISLVRLFHTVFGNREERIADEQDRLMQARLRHDQVDASLAPLHAERARIEQELQLLEGLDERHAELLHEKEALLRARGGDVAERLAQSADRLGELAGQRREIEEAIAAGRFVIVELQAAESDLRGARSWGHLDLMGGGLLTSMAKHSNIDQARARVEQAQRHLRDFVRELRDVAVATPDLKIDIGGFAKFADYFFDGLISDWFVQSRIVNALDRVTTTKDRVEQLLWQLQRQGKQLTEQLEAARRERTTWIEQAG